MRPTLSLRLISVLLVGPAIGLGASAVEANNDSVRPIKPPSAVFFNVTVNPHQVAAGGTADVVVTLRLDGKPAIGAAVQLAMISTPGNDYVFTPGSGTTDAAGTFSTTLRVSRTPGESIIAATSGIFSDQDQVAGTGLAGKAPLLTATNPTRARRSSPLLPLGIVVTILAATAAYLSTRAKRS